MDGRLITPHVLAAFELLITLIYAAGVLVVVWGVAEAVWAFLRLRTLEHSQRLFVRASAIRERLGVHLLLALDIFIGADVIATAVHRDWASVGVLALIVAIRVILSFMLTREIADAHRFVEQDVHPRPEDGAARQT